jgi:Protein of unknown function (DUF3102)
MSIKKAEDAVIPDGAAPTVIPDNELSENDTQQLETLAQHINDIGDAVAYAVIDIGKSLAAAKRIVGHGYWATWLKGNFNWTDRQAQRYIQVFELYGSNPTTLSDMDIDLSALFLLAAPSTPNAAREEILKDAREEQRKLDKNGIRVTHKKVKETVKRHKAESSQSRPSKPTARKPAPSCSPPSTNASDPVESAQDRKHENAEQFAPAADVTDIVALASPTRDADPMSLMTLPVVEIVTVEDLMKAVADWDAERLETGARRMNEMAGSLRRSQRIAA